MSYGCIGSSVVLLIIYFQEEVDDPLLRDMFTACAETREKPRAFDR